MQLHMQFPATHTHTCTLHKGTQNPLAWALAGEVSNLKRHRAIPAGGKAIQVSLSSVAPGDEATLG